MTIKQQGGIFGRNPSFNDLEAEQATVNGVVNIQSNRPQIFLYEQDRTDNNARIEVTGDNLRFSQVDDENSSVVPRVTLEMDTGNFTVNDGNLIIGTSGKGIDFSATSGTGTSELFDDYEEGTWTPTFTSTSASFSYTNQFGSYVKIGGFVSAQFYLNATASGTTSNQVTLSGLPFASANLNAFAQSAGSVWFTGTANVTPLVSNNAATAVIWKNNTAASNLNAVDVSGHYFVGTVFYRAS